MRRSNAPTLQDVAREAGVTAMAASVVLNGAVSSARVSEETRGRILEAASRLRYRPNAVARGLSRRRMDAIGVVSIVDGSELNFYFLEVLSGILAAAAERGQNTTVFSVESWEAAQSKILQFCDGRVDGMIFIAPGGITPGFIDAMQRHTPLVTIHAEASLPNFDTLYNLDVDNEGGAYLAARHLVEQGHRRIAHLAGERKFTGTQQRIAGYRRALEEGGLPFDESLVIECGFSIDAGRDGAEELKRRCGAERTLPTAIACANDALALGCVEVMTRWGVRIPTDISIVGFDDNMTARLTTPPLTTVRQPFRGLGERAVAMLLSQIQDSPAGGESDAGTAIASRPHTESFDVHLIVRESTGPPPALPFRI